MKKYKGERRVRKMDFKNRLQRQYRAIVQDLDVKYILDELYQKNVLSSSEFNHILNVTSREEQVRFLLDYLIQSGTEASYESFVDCLAKDYRWLNKSLIEDLEPIMDDSFEDSLSKGDVPRLPDHHARRTVIENKVADKLRQLKRHEILVLHGMSGSGKTCVAISALRDNPELITNDFNGVVLWLNLANCKTYDDIIAQQTNLLRKASSMYSTFNSYMNMNSSISMSSIASNGDNPISTLDWTWTSLKDRLKTQFLEQSLKECLLVLDEVNDRKCLEALDIGCKILITTRDKEVVANYRPQIVEIENHLEKDESLQIFASCLDENVSRLPRQAKTIHELCKGNPFHIALLGAQLADDKEKLKHHRRHWDYYVKKLEKKEFSSLFTRPNENPMKAIEVCINALNDNILQLFKKLAILPDNVKVSTKVLSKLWNRDTSEVNSIMKQLKAKSLIIETYDREQRSYLYEVHDLIMNYLRTCLKKDEKRRLHDEFLTSYHYTSEHAPVDILDDGYIAFYVGYHILNTYDPQKQSLFKKLFLNLKFLGNKVRLTGPADVLLDLQKYENNIAEDDVDRSLIANIKSYLSTHGTDLYRYQCTDIVQSILQHESQGILFSRASEAAQANSDKNELYFNFLHEQDSDGIKHSTIDVNEQITCISFLGNDLLVSTSDGVVKFFDIPTNKLKKQLFDNERMSVPVEWIGVAYTKNPPIVAVLFASGVIKLWFIDDIEQDVDEDIIEEEPDEIYNNNVPGTLTIKSRMSPIVKCHWTINEDFLVAQTIDMVILYLPTGDVVNVFDNFERNVRLLCSVPCSSDDRYVAVATTGSRKGVEIVDMKTKERKITFEDPSPDSEPVLDILAVIGSNKIITLKSREVNQHAFKISSNTNFKYNKFNTCTIIRSYDVKNNLTFLSMAVNKSGTLLFISTDDSRVMCVDLKTNTYLFDLDNRRGNVVTMAVSEILMWDEFVPNSDVLLTGTETVEKSAKVWYLDAPYISQAAHKKGKVRLTTNFDVNFRQSAASPSQSSTDSTDLCIESTNQTPKRHQSFNHNETKKVLKSTRSLDIRALKRLNLKGICSISEDSEYCRPLLAVIDDNNNIQVMCGRKLLTEIVEKSDDLITTVKIAPFNQCIVYGLQSGSVKKYTLQTKEVTTIMDMYSPVQYMSFVHESLLLVAGDNRCIMAYRLNTDDIWMLQRGNTNLGSQEILNDIQGYKKRSSQADLMSRSSSDQSLESKDRRFPQRVSESQTKELWKGGGLVNCFAVENDLITIETNGAIKLWVDLKLSCILHARQLEVKCAAFENNILVICDARKMVFQIFQLKMGTDTEHELKLIQEKQIDIEITSCDLTADGNILALGLGSGDVVIWNVRAQRQITLLRHHKSKVRSCSFSEVPSQLYRSLGQFGTQISEDVPPLVLVTMAAEIIWWDVSYVMRMRPGSRSDRPNLNAMTPLASPHEREVATDESNSNNGRKFVFMENRIKLGWKEIWNSKTYKQGSKRKEILACIKLTGMYAKRLCHDNKFTCFVTVDNPGHIHIMNVIRKCT